MRSPEEQQEFLEHGRYGEGVQAPKRIHLHRLVRAGLLSLFAGGTLFGLMIALNIGRDDGGPLFFMGSNAFSAVGVALCIAGLVRMRMVQGNLSRQSRFNGKSR
jgi:hypothetical protein